MFNPYYGLLNYVFTALGLISKNLNWLGSADTALGCIITILLTTSVSQPIVLYVAALNNVDHSLVEAAQVDGATSLQTFWRIKWPQVAAHHALYSDHHHHQLLPVLRADRPADLRRAAGFPLTIMYYIYHNAVKLNNFGYGCAMGNHSGGDHRAVQRGAVPSGQIRQLRGRGQSWITAYIK